MGKFSQWFCFGAVLSVMTLGMVQPAHADIIVISGVNNQGTDNVLLNDATNVAIVTGTVNSGLFDVEFESLGGNLNADASGQAVITPAANNDPFNNISFEIEDGSAFTRAVFNLNSATNGTLQLTVSGINITGGTFVDTFAVDANGENFFTVTAINSQLITGIDLTGISGTVFEDLRQVRIGGATDLTAIPEPTSMLLLGSGLFGLAARMRRSRK